MQNNEYNTYLNIDSEKSIHVSGDGWTYYGTYKSGNSSVSGVEFEVKNTLKPKRIIFNNPATIVYWEDGTKTVVKCSENEEFVPEFGLAMAYIRKIYPNRGEFLSFLDKAHYQENKESDKGYW